MDFAESLFAALANIKKEQIIYILFFLRNVYWEWRYLLYISVIEVAIIFLISLDEFIQFIIEREIKSELQLNNVVINKQQDCWAASQSILIVIPSTRSSRCEFLDTVSLLQESNPLCKANSSEYSRRLQHLPAFVPSLEGAKYPFKRRWPSMPNLAGWRSAPELCYVLAFWLAMETIRSCKDA